MFASSPVPDPRFAAPATPPCSGFPVALMFPDVEPEVLAHEAMREANRPRRPGAGDWHAYLHRALPALERHVAAEMARALLGAGTGVAGSRAHADRMRRQAIAAGAVHRARFWADVAEEIGRL